MERAQAEVKAGRKYVDALETQIKSKEAIISAQSRRQTLADAAIVSLQKDVEFLKRAVAEQENTIKIQKEEVIYLKKELDKTNKKLARSRNLNKYLIVGGAILVLTNIFR